MTSSTNRDIGPPDVHNGAVKGALLALCVLAGFSAGCDSAPVTSVAPSPAAPPTPSTARHTLSGTISELVDGVPRPVGADLTVWLWVEQQIPQGTMGSSQSVRTDQNGRYSLPVPDSRVFASSAKRCCDGSRITVPQLEPALAVNRTGSRGASPTPWMKKHVIALHGWRSTGLYRARDSRIPVKSDITAEAASDGS